MREHPDQFRFLTRERYGGVGAVRRAIATELRLFTSDLTVDLARLTAGYDWTTDDLEMAAEPDGRRDARRGAWTCSRSTPRRPEEAGASSIGPQRQLRLIALGMGAWRSKP